MTNSAIATDKLSKSYGATVALDALSLEVPTGEVFGLLGHNGAGKTTTVNLLTTLLEPTYGNAEVAGHSVTSDATGVRGSIGYLPENVQFYDNLTLMENLRFFAHLSGLRGPDQRIRICRDRSPVLDSVSLDLQVELHRQRARSPTHRLHRAIRRGRQHLGALRQPGDLGAVPLQAVQDLRHVIQKNALGPHLGHLHR